MIVCSDAREMLAFGEGGLFALLLRRCAPNRARSPLASRRTMVPVQRSQGRSLPPPGIILARSTSLLRVVRWHYPGSSRYYPLLTTYVALPVRVAARVTHSLVRGAQMLAVRSMQRSCFHYAALWHTPGSSAPSHRAGDPILCVGLPSARH